MFQSDIKSTDDFGCGVTISDRLNQSMEAAGRAPLTIQLRVTISPATTGVDGPRTRTVSGLTNWWHNLVNLIIKQSAILTMDIQSKVRWSLVFRWHCWTPDKWTWHQGRILWWWISLSPKLHSVDDLQFRSTDWPWFASDGCRCTTERRALGVHPLTNTPVPWWQTLRTDQVWPNCHWQMLSMGSWWNYWRWCWYCRWSLEEVSQALCHWLWCWAHQVSLMVELILVIVCRMSFTLLSDTWWWCRFKTLIFERVKIFETR